MRLIRPTEHECRPDKAFTPHPAVMRYINFSGANNGSSTHAEIRAVGKLRVVFSGIEIAGPFAGQMFAEWGAEVIWIENVAWADTIRVQPNYPQLSRRNLHALSLNIFKDEGREAFLKLMETTDIFIEASKGPAFARRGITDEVLWQHNPKLVIAHLSGFGQYGTEEYTNLPAYNTIAQAFSGYLIQDGDVDQPMPAFRIPPITFLA